MEILLLLIVAVVIVLWVHPGSTGSDESGPADVDAAASGRPHGVARPELPEHPSCRCALLMPTENNDVQDLVRAVLADIPNLDEL